jgi:predicted ATPase
LRRRYPTFRRSGCLSIRALMADRRPDRGGLTRLRGRRRECELLEEVIAAVRDGHSRALVLWGEAGVGKTALLEHVVQAAPGLRVVRIAGVESEMELAFAAVHQLCASLLDRLDRLPAPQREALVMAFVARRLLAESVAVLFAAREPSEELQGLPQLRVEGLHVGDARALLGSVGVECG